MEDLGEELFKRAIQAQQNSETEKARLLYESLLLTKPDHPEANHNLGLLEGSVGHHDLAVSLIGTAIKNNSQIPQFWISYIEALINNGDFEKAKEALRDSQDLLSDDERIEYLQARLQSKTASALPSPSIEEKNALIAQSSYLQSATALADARTFSQKYPWHPLGWSVLSQILIESGDINEALVVTKRALDVSPADASAHFYSALAKRLAGDLSAAEALLRKAIDISPELSAAHINLSVVLREQGRLEEAKSSCLSALEIEPQSSEALNNLGNIQHEMGDSKNAEASYKMAYEVAPGDSKSPTNLGILTRELGRIEESVQWLERAVNSNPQDAEAHNNLGISLHIQRRWKESENSYKRALEIEENYAEAHNNLGITFRAQNNLVGAEQSYRRAIQLKPAYPIAHNNLGNTLRELDRHGEAEGHARRALELNPDYAEAHNNLGIILRETGNFDEAEQCYKTALSLNSNLADAYNNLGNLLLQKGDLPSAKAHFENAIKRKKDYAEGFRHLAQLKTFTEDDKDIPEMQRIYHLENLTDDERCQICFGLAKVNEDLGRYETAFGFYAEGNGLRKKSLNYRIEDDREFFKQINANSSSFIGRMLRAKVTESPVKPIFILGMPRSGTTLIEQIVSSHPEVEGGGELTFVKAFGDSISRGQEEASEDNLLRFRDLYLEKIEARSNGKPFITDKMPHNFCHIGLILSSIPEAKIIHVKRDPAAVCWANYRIFFVSRALRYCYSLEDVVEYYGLYESLMKHWNRIFPNDINEVDYDSLTVNQEQETKKLIQQHLQLDWADACLYPEANNRVVATASNLQVRKKIYKNSSKQWKKYEHLLDGAFDNLMKDKRG